MFIGYNNYLILCEPESKKTELADNISYNIERRIVKIDLFDQDNDLLEYIKQTNITLIIDNYSTKDNKNENFEKLLKNEFISVIVISPYPIAIDNYKRLYFDYIFISKLSNEYTISLIHHNYITNIVSKEDFKKMNIKNKYFLLFNKINKECGYYDLKEGFKENIEDSFYDRLLGFLKLV